MEGYIYYLLLHLDWNKKCLLLFLVAPRKPLNQNLGAFPKEENVFLFRKIQLQPFKKNVKI